jgi:phage-related protein
MTKTKVNVLEFNVATQKQTTRTELVELPNPRIAEIENRLQEIRAELAQGDWKTIKHQEGGLSEKDWEVHTSKRASLRSEFNKLELEFKTLT